MNIELPMRLLDWIKESDLVWAGLSSNPSCEAIRLLKKNPTKIKFYYLIENKNVDSIPLLKENPEKIFWHGFSKSQHIFTYDYEKMRDNCLLFKEDLMKERFHPKNLRKFGSWGHEGGIDDEFHLLTDSNASPFGSPIERL